MVLPLLGILALGGLSVWGLDKIGVIEPEDVGEVLGEVVGTTIAAVVQVLPSALEEVGPAVVDGVGKSVKATREALRGQEVAFTAGLTVLVIGASVYWSLRGTLTQPA